MKQVVRYGWIFVVISQFQVAAQTWKEPPIVQAPISICSISPPSDAIVLFDGTNLDQWHDGQGRPARWKIIDGVLEVNGTGNIFTKAEFGDCQLHIEWATPTKITGEGQNRGNSGIYLQGRYEVQILDSYDNKTYPDGMAGAIYGTYPPLVNVSRPPGQWQIYDIIFHPPRLASDKKTIIPGSITVFHNGVLIHDNVPIWRPTTAAAFNDIAEKGPLMLQDHGCPVRFRNIWIRHLPPQGIHPAKKE